MEDIYVTQKKYHIIYADPPYRKGFEAKLADLLSHSGIVKEDTLVILETALDTSVDYVDENYYDLVRIKEYKTNKHVFLRVR